MITVEDTRKAVQIIQYSIRGIAEILVSGEKMTTELISNAALGVVSASSLIDLYLTGSLSERKSHRDFDAQSAIMFLTTMSPFRFQLSEPGMVMVVSWPKDGTEIFQLEGDSSDVRERWEKLFESE